MIRRVEFDDLLVSLAIEAGAELVTDTDVVSARETPDRVKLTTRDGRHFSAPVVIAADGVHSVIARRLGINPGWPASSVALDMMEETPRSALRDIDPSTLWIPYAHQPSRAASLSGPLAAAEGYAYIFPKRDHVNIGIGYVLRTTARRSRIPRTTCSATSSTTFAVVTSSKANRSAKISRRS